MRSVPGKVLLLALLAAAPTVAQPTGYNAPGSLAEKRLSAKEVVTRAYQDARWQLGFLSLDPQLAITDLGYVSNIYSAADAAAESDFKAQGSAGLRGFFHLGLKVLVSPFASLGYSWWQNQEDLRSSNESYGLQLFGDFNRLQLQLQAGRVEDQRNLSSELEVPVNLQNDRLQADLDIDFWGPFRFFATAADGRSRPSGTAAEDRLPGLDLQQLEVDTELLATGLAYELSNGLVLGLGYEERESIYPTDPDGRSHRGSGPLARITFDGTRLSVEAQVSQQDLDFDGRAGTSERDQTIGFGRLGWRLTQKLNASLYAAAQLDASALDSAAIFESRRSGVAMSRRGTGRTRLGAFYEGGEDEFATAASDEVTRIDDFTSWGVNLETRLTDRLTVHLGYVDTRRESSDPEFTRDLQSLIGRVRLGLDLLPW